MAGQSTIQELSGAAGDALEDTPTTSVEELLEIFAELSERVARLERATVLLLAEKNGAELAAATVADPSPSGVYSETPAPPQTVTPTPAPPQAVTPTPAPPQAVTPTPAPAAPSVQAPRAAPARVDIDLSKVDFDLPAHQWGGEANRNAAVVTPIQDSEYPEIKYVDEEDKPKPKRTGPPERVLVRAALETYPHIIESVCIFWGGRECDTYLSKLVIDTRGGRRGFPQEVMDELLFLTEVATIKSGVKPVFTPFDSDKHLQR
jgi:hypothetical protein